MVGKPRAASFRFDEGPAAGLARLAASPRRFGSRAMKKAPDRLLGRGPFKYVSVVAGGGFEPPTFGL